MHILMVAAENDALPRGKVGGIGDVIRDVPKALAAKGQSVSVITPGYGYHSQNNPSVLIKSFNVRFAEQNIHTHLFKVTTNSDQNGVTQYVLESELMQAERPGQLYVHDPDDRPFASDATKFAFFCLAVAEALRQTLFEPVDVIHLHDWHASCLALLLNFDKQYSELKKIPRVYSIHNLALQGIRPFAEDSSSLNAWYPWLKYQKKWLRDPGYKNCINLMRTGINLSHKVHAVSGRYAEEITRESDHENGFFGGERLHKDLQRIHSEGRLVGIINGCEYEFIDYPDLTKRQALETSLADAEQWLHDEPENPNHQRAITNLKGWLSDDSCNLEHQPLLTSVGRLTEQKVGLLMWQDKHSDERLMAKLLESLKNVDGRLLMLGSGDKNLEQILGELMCDYPHFVFLNGFGVGLSELFYEVGDLFLMPSLFEPCGISQMLAMRRGQPCLVNAVGGLAETIVHLQTGFSFTGETLEQKASECHRVFDEALSMMVNEPKSYQSIKFAASQQRFDWATSIDAYLRELYQADGESEA